MKRWWLALCLSLSGPAEAALAPSSPPNCVEMPQATAFRDVPKTVLASRDVGNITLLNWTGDYSRSNSAARAQVANSFYATHADRYDALIVFTTFDFDTGGAQAFYNPVRNDVAGIGLDSFDFSSNFGSQGRLAGVVDMTALTRYRLNPRDPQYSQTLGVLVHELMHRWTVKARYRTTSGAISSDLLGESAVHWSYFLDSDASLMYGNDWADRPDGSFDSVKVRHRLNPLDLYLGGFASAVEVPPQRLIRGGSGAATDLPQLGARTGGTIEQITVDQFIAAEGPRLPAAADAPRSFEAAIVVLLRPDEQLDAEQLLQLEQLRIQAQSYFQAATLGRASLRIHTERKASTPAEAPAYLVDLHPTAASGTAGSSATLLQWLRAAQKPDGRFEDLPATAVRDTAMALRALSFWAPQAPETALARQWLATRTVGNRDQQTWQSFGLGSQLSAPVWASTQSPAGGYGLQDGWLSSPLDTLQAVRALRVSGVHERARLALQSLESLHGSDGGFGFFADSPAQAASVALFADELAQSDLPDAAARLASSRGWLESSQRADGGFGSPLSTLNDSAAVFAAAARLGLGSTRRAQLQDYLLKRLDAPGQPGLLRNSVYLTALTLQGLALEQGDNLSIEGGLLATPAAAVDGQTVLLQALVRNTGAGQIGASVARWFDGEPGNGGLQIGPDLLVPAIPAGQSQRIESSWNSLGLVGPHTLWLVLDALDQIAESREDDNRGSLAVQVQPAPDRPELALLTSEIQLQPQALTTVPSTVRVSGVLRNLGSVAASTAVQLDAVDSNGLRLLARQTLVVPARGQVLFELSFEQTEAVGLDLRLRADPDESIAELDESNNQVDLRLGFGSNTDLAISADDVQVEPANPAQGEEALIRVRVRNRGTADAAAAVLLIEAVQGSTRTQVARLPISLSAGSTVERSPIWRPVSLGPVELDIRIDPDNSIAESDEANNQVLRGLTVAAATGVNLVADAESLLPVPVVPLEGQPLRLSLNVRNLGAQVAGSFAVGLYDADPRAGGRQLASTVVPAGLASAAGAAVELLCPDLPLRGPHTLHVLVDVLDEVAERNENDNIVPLAITALGLPDLSLASGGIQLEPAQPVDGQPLTVRVRVDNLGEQPAATVVLRLRNGLPGNGTNIEPERQIALIEAGGSAELSWTFPFVGAAGDGLLSALVDPANSVRETNETNNTVSVSFNSQSGDAFASPVYFSPNGDGIQDRTTLVFREASSATHRLYIRDGANRIIRSVEPGTGSAPLRFEWDGRDDAGRLAFDGDYSASAELGNSVLGPVRIVLDTNRSSALAAIGTRFQYSLNLPAGFKPPAFEVSNPQRLYAIGPATLLSGVQLASIRQLDVIAGGLPVDRVRPEFWLVHAQSQGLSRVQATSLAFASDGQQLLITVEESGPTVAARTGLWSLSLLNSLPPVRVAQLQSDSRILGELSGGRVVFSGNEVYELAGDAVSTFRSYPGVAADRVLPEGLLQHETLGNVLQTRYIPADPARPVVELPGNDEAPYSIRSRAGLNAAGTHLLVRRHDGAEGRIELIELRSGQAVVAQRGPMMQKIVPGPLASYFPPREEFTLDAIWLNSAEFLVVDSRLREARRFGLDGVQIDSSEIGIRRQGAYGAESISKVLASYPTANGLLAAALDPWTDRLHVLLGEAAFFCFMQNAECYEFAATGTEHGLGLTEHYEIGLGAPAQFVEGNAALTFPDIGDQLRYPALGYFGNPPVSLGGQQPVRYFPSGAILLAGGGFQIRSEGRLTANNRIGNLLDGDHIQSWANESFIAIDGGNSVQVISSLANLPVVLRAQSLGRSIRLSGTVGDTALKSWELSYRRETDVAWQSISGLQATPVFDDILLDWLPPAGGLWRIRLEAVDQAGNRREAVAFADADVPALAPAVLDARLDDRWLSPNGDGSHEMLRLDFRIDRASVEALEVRSLASGSIRRREVLSYGSADLGAHVFEFDGRGDDGQLLPDGDYRLEFGGFSFPLIIDTQAPIGNLRWGTGLPLNQGQPPFGPTLTAADTALDLARAVRGFRTAGGNGEWSETDIDSPETIAVSAANALDRQWRLRLVDYAGNTQNLLLPPVAPVLSLNGLFPQASHVVLPQQLLDGLFIDISRGLSGLRLESSTTSNPTLWRLLGQHPGTRADLTVEQVGAQWLGYAVLAPLDLRADAVGSWLNVRGIGRTQSGLDVLSNELKLQIGAFPKPRALTSELGRCDVVVANLNLPKPWSGMRLSLRPQSGGAETQLAGTADYAAQSLHFDAALPLGNWTFTASLVDADGVLRNSEVGTGSCQESASIESVKVTGQAERQQDLCGAAADYRIRLRVEPSGLIPASQPRQYRISLFNPLTRSSELLLDTQVAANARLPLFDRLLNVNGWPAGNVAVEVRIGDQLQQAGFEVNPSFGPPEPYFVQPVAGARVCGRKFPAELRDARYPTGDFFKLEWGGGSVPQDWLPALLVEGELALSSADDLPHGLTTLRARAAGPDGAVVCSQRTLTIDARTDAFRRGQPTPLLQMPGNTLGLSSAGDPRFRELSVPLAAIEAAAWSTIVQRASVANPLDAIGASLGTIANASASVGDFDARWDGRLGGLVVADGRYVLTTIATDSCGHKQGFVDALIVDSTPPQVVLEQPVDGAVLDAAVLQVIGSLSDQTQISRTVELASAGSPEQWQLLPLEQVGNNALRAVHPRGTANGAQRLRITATDQLGNRTVLLRNFTFGAPTTLLAAVQAQPGLFSPNADGVLDQVRIEIDLRRSALLDVQIQRGGQTVKALASAVAAGSGLRSLSWDGRDTGGVAVADGEVELLVRATDAGAPGIFEEQRLQLSLDTIAPVFSELLPVGTELRCDSVFSFAVNDPHLERYSAQLRNAAGLLLREVEGAQVGTVGFGSLQSWVSESGLRLQLSARDQAGNVAERTLPLALDCEVPQARLDLPLNGAILPRRAGASVSISGSAADEQFARYWLEISPPGAVPSWQLLHESTTPIEAAELYRWTPSQADGELRLRLRVADRAGNESTAETLVQIDGTPPLAELSAPADGAAITTTLQVRGTASDEHLDHYELQFARGNSAVWESLLQQDSNVTAGLLGELDIPGEGEFRLRLRALDQAGFETITAPRTLRIDTLSPPAPLELTALVEQNRHVRLSWSAVTVGDLAGYRLERDGTVLGSAVLTSRNYLDLDVTEGRRQYRVYAVDQAGNLSAASAPAFATVDHTAPELALIAPLADERLRGNYAVLGTAAAEDLREFRLSWQPLAPPGAEIELRRSALSVRAAELGRLDTTAIAPGTRGRLRLTAEDLLGNQAMIEREALIDNLPPAAPTGLALQVLGADLRVFWNPNSESDLLGYLLYRNGVPVNGSAGLPDDLRALALSLAQYLDRQVPDGHLVYRVYAIDLAGNISPPSEPVATDIESGPPDLEIVAPAFGYAFETSVEVVARSADEDIATVSFAWAAEGSSQWHSFAELQSPPWIARWTPASGTPLGAYQLRAVATDLGGRIDPSPPEVAVQFADLTLPPEPATVTATADADQVRVQWTAVQASDLAGYRVLRSRFDGSELQELTASPISALELTDSALPDGRWRYAVQAVDQAGNRSLESSDLAQVFGLELETPLTPTLGASIELRGYSQVPGELRLQRSPDFSQPPATSHTDDEGRFSLAVLPLALGNNVLEVRVLSADGDLSRAATLHLDRATRPGTPTGLAAAVNGTTVALNWTAPADSDLLGYLLRDQGQPLPAAAPLAQAIDVSAVCCGDPLATVDSDPASYWSNSLDGSELRFEWPQPALIDQFELQWTSSDYRATRVRLEAWSGHHWVDLLGDYELPQAALHVLRLPQPYRTTRLRLRPLAAASFEVQLAEVSIREQPLIAATSYSYSAAEGQHRYTVSAWNWYGFESAQSAPPIAIGVGDADPPAAVTLSGSVEGADATLTWSASPAPDVARYRLEREGLTVALLPAAAPRSYLDAGLANGRYRYQVYALDAVGNLSEPSNLLSLDIADLTPGAPRLDEVTALPAGNIGLSLRWTPAASGPLAVLFEVERAGSVTGPFVRVHSGSTTEWIDTTDLVLGQRYWYRVLALDQPGNRSPASNVLSGLVGVIAAPLPPVLTLPTLAAEPMRWDVRSVAVCGSASPSSIIQITRNGQPQGSPLTALGSDQRTLIPLGFDLLQLSRLSPQGDLYYAEILLSASGNVEGQLRRFDGAVPVKLDVLPQQPRFSARGDELFGLDPVSGRLLRFDLGSGVSSVLAAELTQVSAYASSADGQQWVIAAQRGGESGLWRYGRSEQTLVKLAGLQAEQLVLPALALSPDGRSLLHLSQLGELRLLDLDSGLSTLLSTAVELTAPLPQLAPDVSSVSWIEANATGFALQLYSFSNEQTRTLQTLSALPQFLFYAPDGRELALVDGNLQRLSLVDGSLLRSIDLGLPGTDLLDLHSSASGRLLVHPKPDHAALFASLDLAGAFCLRAVPTVAGENRFSAIASDAAGNLSSSAAPVIVLVPGGGSPDLSVSSADLRFSPAGLLQGQSALVFVTVRNRGAVAAPASRLRVVFATPDGSSSVLPSTQVPAIAAGASSTLTLNLGPLNQAGIWRLTVQLDPDEQLVESDESNNQASASLAVSADATPQLELSLTGSSLQPGATLRGTVRVLPTQAAFSGRVRLQIRDASGALLATLAETATGSLAATQAWSSPFDWTPQVLAGGYQVQAQLLSLAGNVLAERSLPFQIQTSRTVLLNLRSDRQSYAIGETVALNTTLHFSAGNALLSNTSLRLTASAASGAVLWSWQRALGTLTPGARLDQTVPWALGSTPVGSYLLTQRLSADGYNQEISHSVLVTSATAGSGVLGSLRSLPGSTVSAGSAARLEWTLRNLASSALDGVQVRLRLLRPPGLAEVFSETSTLNLSGQESAVRSTTLAAELLNLGDYLATLEARLPGDAPDTWRRLAQSTLTVVDGSAPLIVLERPLENSFAPRPTALRARITDTLSGVDRAELRLDGGSWLSIGLVEDGRYGRTEGNLAEGPHQFQVRAWDRQGNQSQSAVLNFIVDATAPVITISGVSDGQNTQGSVTPVVQFSDAHLGPTSLYLNSEVFTSGTTLTAEGQYFLTARANDLAGNQTTRVVGFNIDRTGPLVSFAAPDPDSEISTDTVAVTLQSEIHVLLTLRSGAWTTTTDSLDGFVEIPAVPLLPGSNTLTAFATDPAGNIGPSVSLPLTRTEGSASWLGDLTPATPEIAAGATVALNARIENRSASPRSANFRVRVLAPVSGTQVGLLEFSHSFAANAIHTETLSLPTSGFALGNHALVLELLDAAGPAQELGTAAVQVVDRQPPQLSILSPPALVGASLVFDVGATDALSSVQLVQARLDAGSWFDLQAVPGNAGHYSVAPLVISEGPHLLEVRATDLYDNSASASRNLDSDQSAPLISISGVSDGQLANGALTALVSISDAHPASQSITLNSAPYLSGTPIVGDGSYNLRVSAADQLGNSAERNLQFTIDSTPPNLTLTQPLEGAILLSEQTPVSGSTEPNATVLLIAGSYQSTAVANAQGAFTFAAVPLLVGANTISARATDLAGNVGLLRSVRVEYRLNGGVQLSGSLTVPAQAPQGQPLLVDFSVRNISTAPAQNLPIRLEARRLGQTELLGQHALQVSLAPNASQSSNHSFATALWPLGDIELRLEAQYTGSDGSLVWTPLTSTVINLRDAVPPLVDWLAPANGAWVSSSVSVIATASDVGSGISRVEARLGSGLPVQLSPSGNGQFTADLPTSNEGVQALTLSATDVAGNTAQAPPRTLQVDRQLPVVSILDVTDGQLGRDPVLPRIVVSDANPTTLSATLDAKPYQPGTPVNTEGLHLLIAQATDLAGNRGTAQVSFSIDRTPPPLHVIHPANGATLLSTQLNLIGSSEAGARISASVLGVSQEALADGKGQFSFSLALARGPNTIVLQARDGLDNSSPPLGLTVQVIADPVITLLGALDLKEADYPHGAPIDFVVTLRNLGNTHLTALPLRLRVESLKSVVTQTDWLVDLPVNQSVTRPLHFETRDWPLGRLRLVFEADVAAAGTREPRAVELASRRITLVDRTAPVLSLLTPQANQVLGRDQLIEARASDPLTGIAAVEARFDGSGAWLPMNPAAGSALDRYTLGLDALAAGSHQVQLRAADGAGNSAAVAAVNFSLRRTLELSVSQPIDGVQTESAQIDFVGATEAGARVDLRLPGGLHRETIADAQGRFSYSAVNLNIGANTFTLQSSAADGATSPALEWHVQRRGIPQIQVDGLNPGSLLLLLLLIGLTALSTGQLLRHGGAP